MAKSRRVKIIITIVLVPILILVGVLGFFYFGFKNAKGIDTYQRYGKDSELIIAYTSDNLSMSLHGETRETKICYFYETDDYLYFINKWSRYTVVSLSLLKVTFQTEDIMKIPEHHREVFSNRSKFEDLRSYDRKENRDAIEFGDGTIFIYMSESLYLYSEKAYESNYQRKMIEESIDRYKVLGSYLYLVGENGGYYIVNFDTYEIILNESDTERMTTEDKLIFENTDDFIAKEEA